MAWQRRRRRRRWTVERDRHPVRDAERSPEKEADRLLDWLNDWETDEDMKANSGEAVE